MNNPLEAYLKSEGLKQVSKEEGEDLPQTEEPKLEQEPQVEGQLEVSKDEEDVHQIIDESDDVEPKNEVKPEVESKSEDQPEKSLEELLKEKTNGKFSSFEEIEEKLSSLENKENEDSSFKSKFDEESISRLEKILDGGLSWDRVAEIAKIQTLDVDSLDDRQALVQMMELKEGLSPAEIKHKLLAYDKLKDVDTEDLIDEEDKVAHFAKVAEYERLAKQSRDFLTNIKNDEKYQLPELKSTQDKKQQEEALKQQQQEFEKLQKLYESGVQDTVKSFDSIKLDLGENNDFEFELNDEMKQQVREEMLNVNNYYKNFEGDGEVLFNKMAEFTAKRLFFDKILQSAVKSTINDGQVKAIKDINNVVDKTNTKNPSKESSFEKMLIEGYKKVQ